jgi:Tfp pilus assembly protein PilF
MRRVAAWWPIPLVAAVSGLVRLVSFLDRRDSIYFDRPILDSLWIHQWAASLAAGETTGADAYFRAPLYPYLLAGVYRIFGATTVPVVLLQHVLGIGTAVLLFLVGRRLFTPAIGLAAGLGWGLYWTAVLFEGEILIVTLATFLGVAFLDRVTAAASAVGRRRWMGAFGAGVLLGVAAIARPNFLVLVPLGMAVVAGWPGLGPRRAQDGGPHPVSGGPVTGRWRGVLLIGVGVLLPIVPVTARNLLVAGDPVLIASQGGLNLYVGNGPGADGKTAQAPGATGPMRRTAFESDFRDNITLAGREVAEAEVGRPLRGSEVSRYWTGRTLDAVGEDPLRWLGLLGRKLIYFCNGYEISDNKDLAELQAEGRWWWVAPVRLIWVWPLALLGLVVLFQKQRSGNVVVWFLFLYGFSVILFFVNARLRLPAVPALLLLAAVGGDAVWRMVREVRGDGMGARRALFSVTVGALIVGGVVSGVRWLGVDERRGMPAFRLNRAVMLIESGDCAGALRAFEEAIALDPGAVEGWFGKARAHERCGDPSRAEEEFDRLRREHAGFVPAHLAVARLRSLRGAVAAADSVYELVLVLEPELPEAHLNYASHLARTERFAAAAHAFERGLVLDPRRLSSWIAYGYTLAALGETEHAREAWHRALRLDPGNRAATDGLRRLASAPTP